MNYSFDTSYAVKYGVDEAIMIENLRFWIIKNRANKKHFKDDRTWTYNSISAFTSLFPFWTFKQIRRILESLREKKVLRAESMSEEWSDRTYWYAFENEAEFLPPQPDLPKRANAMCPNGQMACAQMGNSLGTVIKPDNKPTLKEIEPPIELPRGFPQTAKDAITACSTAGIPPVFIEQDWGECFARGGKDRQGHAIYNYVVHAKVAYSRHKSWQEEHKLLQPNGHNGAPRVKTMDEATVYDCL